MNTEPKLLTEAELRVICGLAEDIDSADAIEEILRDHHLIADEPVDRLMADAKAMVEEMTGHEVAWTDERVSLVLAALKRGMELAPRKELTREVVQVALKDIGYVWPDLAVTRLHAALTEALQ